MMTKVISLSDDAYRRLKKRKGSGESFSDVVVRLTGDKGGVSIMSLKGSWVGNDAEKVSRVIAEERENSRDRELRI